VAAPVFLPFMESSQNYQVGYCLSNCEAEHRKTNVEIIFGWIIWERRSQSFIEAEFHSIVRRNDQLQDITPRKDGEALVLFVPDMVRTANRQNDCTWDTWTNHKKLGSVLEPSRKILIQDAQTNIWAA
jgi:hypothetical protein